MKKFKAIKRRQTKAQEAAVVPSMSLKMKMKDDDHDDVNKYDPPSATTTTATTQEQAPEVFAVVTPPSHSVALSRRAASQESQADAPQPQMIDSMISTALLALIEDDDDAPSPSPSSRRNLSGLFEENQSQSEESEFESLNNISNEIVFERVSGSQCRQSIFDTAWNNHYEGFYDEYGHTTPPTEPSASSLASEKDDDKDHELRGEEPSPSPEKIFHSPTASRSSPRKQTHKHKTSPISAAHIQAKSPLRNLRYSLNKGRKVMSTEMKKQSKISMKLVPKQSPQVVATSQSHQQQQQSHTTSASTGESIKIFVLLLQPHLKFFELIQLIFATNGDTTVGDLIQAIPSHATEPTLADQEYIGLTRPKKRSQDFTDLQAPVCAAAPKDKTGVFLETVNIQAGEIIVALPVGFSHNKVVSMSKKILANPKIQKLLEQTNPLALPRQRQKKKQRSSSSKNNSTGVLEVAIPNSMTISNSSACITMEQVLEESELEDSTMMEALNPVQRAIDFAAQLSKTTNRRHYYELPSPSPPPQAVTSASLSSSFLSPNHTPKAKNTHSHSRMRHSINSIPETSVITEVSFDNSVVSKPSSSSSPGVLDAFLCAHSSSSTRSFQGINGYLDEDTSLDSSLCSSLQSYSSWSTSFDVSLKNRAATTPTTPVINTPALSSAVKKKTKKNPYLKTNYVSASTVKYVMARAGILYCLVMVVRFIMDPVSCTTQMAMMQAQPLGILGAIQVMICFVGLFKLQKEALKGGWFGTMPKRRKAIVHHNRRRRLSLSVSSNK